MAVVHKASDTVIFTALALFSLSLFSLASAISGNATFYKPPYNPSACLGKRVVKGIMLAAVSNQMWKNGRVCGKHLRVSCTGKANESPRACRGSRGQSITVRIVDLCDGCKGNHIDLSLQAFAKIADPDAGVVKISFDLSVIATSSFTQFVNFVPDQQLLC
ncbi:hypothetical protein HS088_TW04G00040 [Tripterygium wilfordii]|uniref:Expansin-like EG45 domain-containing protein n=1 Tax=Tripterygium wilfordii TaxID=458696 RepID=A0A7J7DP13_TRIWF|nr:hypothetical protein HS088_TW04G00040 [Tripterygium wilfordii]